MIWQRRTLIELGGHLRCGSGGGELLLDLCCRVDTRRPADRTLFLLKSVLETLFFPPSSSIRELLLLSSLHQSPSGVCAVVQQVH